MRSSLDQVLQLAPHDEQDFVCEKYGPINPGKLLQMKRVSEQDASKINRAVGNAGPLGRD
jgi:hypothetical protein